MVKILIGKEKSVFPSRGMVASGDLAPLSLEVIDRCFRTPHWHTRLTAVAAQKEISASSGKSYRLQAKQEPHSSWKRYRDPHVISEGGGPGWSASHYDSPYS